MSTVNDASGLWETTHPPGSEAAGSLGPEELIPARPAFDAGEEPWRARAAGASTRTPEHATGHVLDTVA